jgi:hypothetical protein
LLTLRRKTAAIVNGASPDCLKFSLLARRMTAWRRLTGIGRGRITAGLALALGVAGLGAVVPWAESSQQRPPPAAVPLPPVWREVSLFAPGLVLNAPGLKDLPARRRLFRSDTGAHEERLTRGTFEAADAPFMHIVLRHDDGERPASLFVGMARHAASEGHALLHLAAPTSLASKFGAMASATARLAYKAAERGCLVFRHRDHDFGIELAGWYCDAGGRAPAPLTVSCLLDRLGVVAEAGDEALSRRFTGTDRVEHCPAEIAPAAIKGEAAPVPAPTKARSRAKRQRH